MQGAVFGTSAVLSSYAVNMSYPQSFIDPLTQAGMLDQAVLNRAYAITWLNQEFPAFTTPQYTLQPFSPLSLSDGAANWTANTVKYWTELNCWPAKAELQKMEAMSMANFLDGRGCNASGIITVNASPASVKYKMQYIGYQDSAWADYSLQNPGCGRGAWNEFLAIWAMFNNKTMEKTVRGSFCEATYWKQNVTATVMASTLRPVDGSIVARAAPELLPEAEFNSSAFQYLLGAGFSSVDMPRDFPSTRILDQFSRLTNVPIQRPLSPLTPFALGYQNFTIDQYENSTVVAQSFLAVHRMLFSIAFSHLLGNSTTTAAANVEGYIFVPQYAITVSRLFSALVEGVLGLVVVMALLLLWMCRRSESMLTSEPSSLAAHVRLVRNSQNLPLLFSKTGHMRDDELKLKLGGYRFRLCCGCLDRSATPSLLVVGRPEYEEQASKRESARSEVTQTGYLAPVKPIVLRPVAGGVFMLVIAAALGAIIYLKRMDSLLGGKLANQSFPSRLGLADMCFIFLHRPSTSFYQQKCKPDTYQLSSHGVFHLRGTNLGASQPILLHASAVLRLHRRQGRRLNGSAGNNKSHEVQVHRPATTARLCTRHQVAPFPARSRLHHCTSRQRPRRRPRCAV